LAGAPDPAGPAGAASGGGRRRSATARDPLSAVLREISPTPRAQGLLDPLIGRPRAAADDRSALPPAQEQSGVRRRGRRRQTAMAEGLANRLLATADNVVPEPLEDAEVFALDTRDCSPAPASAATRGTVQAGDQSPERRPKEPFSSSTRMHSTVGAGATARHDGISDADQADLTAATCASSARRRSKFKQIEKDRALARGCRRSDRRTDQRRGDQDSGGYFAAATKSITA